MLCLKYTHSPRVPRALGHRIYSILQIVSGGKVLQLSRTDWQLQNFSSEIASTIDLSHTRLLVPPRMFSSELHVQFSLAYHDSIKLFHLKQFAIHGIYQAKHSYNLSI